MFCDFTFALLDGKTHSKMGSTLKRKDSLFPTEKLRFRNVTEKKMAIMVSLKCIYLFLNQ